MGGAGGRGRGIGEGAARLVERRRDRRVVVLLRSRHNVGRDGARARVREVVHGGRARWQRPAVHIELLCRIVQ